MHDTLSVIAIFLRIVSEAKPKFCGWACFLLFRRFRTGKVPFMRKSNGAIWPLATLCCLLWGSAATAIKIGFGCFELTNAFIPGVLLFAGLRFFGAGLVILLVYSLHSHGLMVPSTPRGWRDAALLGAVQTFLQYAFNFVGVASASGIVASVMNGTGNLFAILLSCTLFRQEKMTLRKALGTALGLGGIVMMNLGASAAGTFALLGAVLLLFASLSGGVGTCLSKGFSRRESPVVLAAWQQIFGGAMLLAVALLSGGSLPRVTPAGVGVLLYLVGVSAVTYSLWNGLLKKHPVSSVAVFGFLIPLFGVVFSALLLGEGEQALRWQTWAALALVCAGIVLVTREKKA